MPSLSEETNGRIERLMPGSTIGIIGGGQLGRMMALSARSKGRHFKAMGKTLRMMLNMLGIWLL